MKTIDNKTYWVDRFDHIMTEEEFCDLEITGFDDAENLDLKDEADAKLFEDYLQTESKLIHFLVDITKSIQPTLNEVQYKIRKKGAMDFYLNKGLDPWKLECLVSMHDGMFSSEPKKLTSEIECRFYLELALREKVDLTVLMNETVLTFGFDLRIIFQCIDKEYLKKYCDKHQLYILDEWYRTFWNE